jgi:hypothetical protein
VVFWWLDLIFGSFGRLSGLGSWPVNPAISSNRNGQ